MTRTIKATKQSARLACSAVCALALISSFARPTAEARPRVDRCPSDVSLAGDPLDPETDESMGPHSDLAERPATFCSVPDRTLLSEIKTSRIQTIRYNSGGSSISLRLELRGGHWALFKPSQFIENTVPRKEVLAYRINRLLGMSRVPPSTTRTIHTSRFHRTMKDGKVLRDRVLSHSKIINKKLRGAACWWIPRIRPLPLEKWAWRARWTKWLDPTHPLPHQWYDLAGQISRMVTFDMLINNQDRFSGANILATRDGRRLYFMDNALSFFPDMEGRRRARRSFLRAKRFSLSLYRAMKRLSAETIREELSNEKNVAWRFLITPEELKGLMQRRDIIVSRVDEQIVRHGWDRVMVFP